LYSEIICSEANERETFIQTNRHTQGKKTTLLLVGTKTERFLMGYRISKAAGTAPMLMFCFPTNHGGPIASVQGFVPKSAINYSDAGVFFATCALGTREVKLWNTKGASPLCTIDAQVGALFY
jgi:hypothetical protein